MSMIMGTIFIIIGIILAIAIYFLPTVIGSKRGLSSQGALFLVNLLCGWTALGWIVCLIWAATGATRAQDDFYANAAKSPPLVPVQPAVLSAEYTEAYAKERARLDHEDAQRRGAGAGVS